MARAFPTFRIILPLLSLWSLAGSAALAETVTVDLVLTRVLKAGITQSEVGQAISMVKGRVARLSVYRGPVSRKNPREVLLDLHDIESMSFFSSMGDPCLAVFQRALGTNQSIRVIREAEVPQSEARDIAHYKFTQDITSCVASQYASPGTPEARD